MFFLEYYGGLTVYRSAYSFSVLGTGPMVEANYGSIRGDDALMEFEEYGVVSVGSLGLKQGEYRLHYAEFYLDLIGRVQQGCIIGVGPWGIETVTPREVLSDLPAHAVMWRVVSNSFVDWLGQVADTHGALGYD